MAKKIIIIGQPVAKPLEDEEDYSTFEEDSYDYEDDVQEDPFGSDDDDEQVSWSPEGAPEQEAMGLTLDELAAIYQQGGQANKDQIAEEMLNTQLGFGGTLGSFLSSLEYKHGLPEGSGLSMLGEALHVTLGPQGQWAGQDYEKYLVSTLKGMAQRGGFEAKQQQKGLTDKEQVFLTQLDPYIRAVSPGLKNRSGDPEVPDDIMDLNASDAEKAAELYKRVNWEYGVPGRVDSAIQYWDQASKNLMDALKANPQAYGDILQKALEEGKHGIRKYPVVPSANGGYELGYNPDMPLIDKTKHAEGFFGQVRSLFKDVLDEYGKEVAAKPPGAQPGPYEALVQQVGLDPEVLQPGTQNFLQQQMTNPAGYRKVQKNFEDRFDGLTRGGFAPTTTDEGETIEISRTQLAPDQILELKEEMEAQYSPEELQRLYGDYARGVLSEGGQPGSYEDFLQDLALRGEASPQAVQQRQQKDELPPVQRDPNSWALKAPAQDLFAKTPEALSNLLDQYQSLQEQRDVTPDAEKPKLDKKLNELRMKIDDVAGEDVKAPLWRLFDYTDGDVDELKERADDLAGKITYLKDNVDRGKWLDTLARMAYEGGTPEIQGDGWSQDPYGAIKYELAKQIAKSPSASKLMDSILKTPEGQQLIPALQSYQLPEAVMQGTTGHGGRTGPKVRSPEEQKLMMLAREAIADMMEILSFDFDEFQRRLQAPVKAEAVRNILRMARFDIGVEMARRAAC